jgi:hypothetical protein
MNRLTPLAVAFAAALPCATPAAVQLTVYSSAQPGTLSPQAFRNGGEGMAIPGYAMVREDRRFDLRAGRNVVRVGDVPALLDPTTVSVASLTDPAGTRVAEQNFEFDLTSTSKLLSRYLDRDITVEAQHGSTVESVSGTLLGTQGGLTLRQPDGSVRIVTQQSGIRLPSLPGGLISKPTLVWNIDAPRAGAQEARIAYQTGGMTWWADYNLVLSTPRGGGCKADVGAWVTLVNQSGAAFTDAKLKLVAGDVHRAEPRRNARYEAVAAPRALESKAADNFSEKSFFEYHLYTLGRTTTLPDNSMKQLELFPAASGVPCEKALVYYGQGADYGSYGSPMTDRNPGNTSNHKVDVYLRLRNAAAGGLGVPLPAGRMRVAQRDEADGALEFIGEDLVDHTPRDETVQLKLGNAFDVVGERKQVDFRIDTRARWMEEEIEVRVRNQKPDEAVNVMVRESLYRWSAWKITQNTHDFRKEDARTVHFPVRVAAKGEAVVRYTVRYTW